MPPIPTVLKSSPEMICPNGDNWPWTVRSVWAKKFFLLWRILYLSLMHLEAFHKHITKQSLWNPTTIFYLANKGRERTICFQIIADNFPPSFNFTPTSPSQALIGLLATNWGFCWQLKSLDWPVPRSGYKKPGMVQGGTRAINLLVAPLSGAYTLLAGAAR